MTDSKCPAQNELADFLDGLLDGVQGELLTDHVDHCPSCQDTIVGLGSRDTSASQDANGLLRALQQVAEPDSLESEEQCAAATLRVQDLGSLLQTATGKRTNESRQAVELDRLGPYEIQARLGSGGIGTVYRARHTRLKRTVAIKVLRPERLVHDVSVLRFEREMGMIGNLDHPNIVRATDADEEGGVPYLVMEFIDGVDLSRLARSCGPLPVREACESIRQAAEGLQYAHDHGLVHRDVKPANLMLGKVTPDDTSCGVRVMDLGLAQLREAESDEPLTETGQLMGTIDYMAPEQMDDTRAVDARADVYSLGATLCKLLTGRTRYDVRKQTSRLQKLKALATEDPPPVATFAAELPNRLAMVIDRMLSPDPEKRYATPREVAKALQPFCEGADLNGLLQRAVAADCGSLESRQVDVQPRRHAATKARRWPRQYVVTAVISALLAALLFFAAIAVRVATPEGTVVLKFDDPSLIGSVVTIDDQYAVTVQEADQAEPLQISADGKERALKIVRNGIPIFSRKVKIKPDEKRTIEVMWEPPRQIDQPSLNNDPELAIAPFATDQANAYQQAWAAHLASTVKRTNSIGMQLRLIPAGEFSMGAPASDTSAAENEKPQHRVRLTKPFWIGETEVTVGQFRAFVEDTKYVTQAESDGGGAYSADASQRMADYTWDQGTETDAYPVHSVSWYDAVRFCQWLTEQEGQAYRLPTEAEWEFACRAGTATRYNFGDEFDPRLAEAWSDSASIRAVRCFPPNAFGLYEMHGNVHEICLDSGRSYTSELAIDPAGNVESAETTAVRGGAMSSYPERLRSSNRYLADYRYFPNENFANVVKGFRVVMAPSSSK